MNLFQKNLQKELINMLDILTESEIKLKPLKAKFKRLNNKIKNIENIRNNVLEIQKIIPGKFYSSSLFKDLILIDNYNFDKIKFRIKNGNVYIQVYSEFIINNKKTIVAKRNTNLNHWKNEIPILCKFYTDYLSFIKFSNLFNDEINIKIGVAFNKFLIKSKIDINNIKI